MNAWFKSHSSEKFVVLTFVASDNLAPTGSILDLGGCITNGFATWFVRLNVPKCLATCGASSSARLSALALSDHFRLADELETICGPPNSAAIERPVRPHNPPGDGPRTLTLGAGLLALRVQVDVAAECGKRVRE